MKITLMGTGTSHGLPVIGCDCHVCSSPYKKDKRMRCSAYVQHQDKAILIDAGPEFRLQALRTGIKQIDTVLLTHAHADHLHGLDDLRIFSYVKLGGVRQASQGSAQDLKVTESEGDALPIYTNSTAINDIHYRFAYVFGPPKLGGGMPKLRLIDADSITPEQPLMVGSIHVLPIPMMHGPIPTTGWLLSCEGLDGKRHSIAYLTDCSQIPDSSLLRIQQNCGILDHVIIDGLRRKPHSTHCSYEEALAYAEQLSPRNIWLTHLNHDLRHTEILRFLKTIYPKHPALQKILAAGGTISPAYDGLVLTAGENEGLHAEEP
ncbi:MAG: MBL fold metallo-hydrolase [Treponema sp.]|nr:MBL fold metallo-hydrolase [Treponema sp.]